MTSRTTAHLTSQCDDGFDSSSSCAAEDMAKAFGTKARPLRSIASRKTRRSSASTAISAGSMGISFPRPAQSQPYRSRNSRRRRKSECRSSARRAFPSKAKTSSVAASIRTRRPFIHCKYLAGLAQASARRRPLLCRDDRGRGRRGRRMASRSKRPATRAGAATPSSPPTRRSMIDSPSTPSRRPIAPMRWPSPCRGARCPTRSTGIRSILITTFACSPGPGNTDYPDRGRRRSQDRRGRRR